MNIPQSFIDTVYRLCDEQKAKKEPRRIVQIAATPESEHHHLFVMALCNDGSMWSCSFEHGTWETWFQLPEIPQ